MKELDPQITAAVISFIQLGILKVPELAGEGQLLIDTLLSGVASDELLAHIQGIVPRLYVAVQEELKKLGTVPPMPPQG